MTTQKNTAPARGIGARALMKPKAKKPRSVGRPRGSGAGFTARIELCVTPEQRDTYEHLGDREWLRQTLTTLKEKGREPVREAVSRPVSDLSSLTQIVNPPIEMASPSAFGERFTLPTLPFFPTRVDCGFPSPAADYAAEELDLNARLVPRPAATFLVQATGLSMVDAGIDPGDFLIVDRSLEPRHNDIVLLWIDNEYTVKRLKRQASGEVSFHPENEGGNFPVLVPNEYQDCQIYGVVRSIIKELR